MTSDIYRKKLNCTSLTLAAVNINTKHVCGHTKHYTTVVYDKTLNAVLLKKNIFLAPI